MIEVAYLKEKDKLKAIPHEVQETVFGILEVLDSKYGVDRNYKDDGGYVAILDTKEHFQQIKDNSYIECDNIIPECVDKIICKDGKIYTNFKYIL
jgi:hypothetical protein